MIDQLSGTVLSKSILGDAGRAVIGVGGIGFSVLMTSRELSHIHQGDNVTLNTVMIVREDDISLYGFVAPTASTTFDILRSVPGVGAKTALGILSTLEISEIAAAVAQDKSSVLAKVKGIGPKSAKVITSALAGKLDAVAGIDATAAGESSATVDHSAVVTGLVGLGWNADQAADAVAEISQSHPAASDVQLLKLALQLLGQSL